jgi:hypothetical protein
MMKLALRRRGKAERAIDATGDLAKLWAGAKLTKGTARAGRKSARLKTAGGSKTGRRAAIGKAVVGSKTGRRAAIGKAVASSPRGRDAGRKALETALAGKAVKGAAKRRGGRGRGRKLLVLGGAAGAVAIALKARKGKPDQQAEAWTPPDVPVGGATVAGDTTAPGTVTPSPTGGAPTDAADPATLRDGAPNAGTTGWPPEAAHEQAGR